MSTPFSDNRVGLHYAVRGYGDYPRAGEARGPMPGGGGGVRCGQAIHFALNKS